MTELVVMQDKGGVLMTVSIRTEDGLVNLTDLWQRFGDGDKKKKPTFFLRRKKTKELMAKLGTVAKTQLGTSTYAGVQLALTYLQWMSTDIQIKVNDIVIERMEEEADPDLAADRGIDRAVKGYQRQGKSDEWIEKRLQGKIKRREFTGTLQERGCRIWWEYANCTDAINVRVLGGTSADLKRDKNLKKKDSLRDHLDPFSLAALSLTEIAARERLERENTYGYKQVLRTCDQTAQSMQRFINETKGESK